ncbi:hypothetical protein GCM10027341_38520 [Spirosoma knui]
MPDSPSANNGFGSVGLLNIRSEEFFIHECRLIANTPLILSNNPSLSATGINYTAVSPFQTLTPGAGSMGVVSINGTSLQGLERRQPAMVLIGTNSVNFQGYLGRIVANTGNNETAIQCISFTTNLKVHATVESYSRLLQARDTGFGSSEIDIVTANATAPNTELIDVTGSIVAGLKARVSLPLPTERSNRYVLYHAPIGGGNQPAGGTISNSEITCFDITSNQFITTGNMLKRATNVVFNTSKPFEKRGGRIHQLFNNNTSAGTNNAVATVTALQFLQANQQAINNTNGGYYRVWLDGVVRAGSYYSGAAATLSFQAQVLVNQRLNGAFDAPSITIITLDKNVTNPSYLDISGVVVAITFANGVGTVTVTPRVLGTANNEPVIYDGQAELQSDFLVNDPIPL